MAQPVSQQRHAFCCWYQLEVFRNTLYSFFPSTHFISSTLDFRSFLEFRSRIKTVAPTEVQDSLTHISVLLALNSFLRLFAPLYCSDCLVESFLLGPGPVLLDLCSYHRRIWTPLQRAFGCSTRWLFSIRVSAVMGRHASGSDDCPLCFSGCLGERRLQMSCDTLMFCGILYAQEIRRPYGILQFPINEDRSDNSFLNSA